MIEVRFFARIREQLGVDRMTVAAAPGLTVGLLREQLIADRDHRWKEVLEAGNIVKAVNHQVVDDGQSLNDGDEVAFFPPVTGG